MQNFFWMLPWFTSCFMTSKMPLFTFFLIKQVEWVLQMFVHILMSNVQYEASTLWMKKVQHVLNVDVNQTKHNVPLICSRYKMINFVDIKTDILVVSAEIEGQHSLLHWSNINIFSQLFSKHKWYVRMFIFELCK